MLHNIRLLATALIITAIAAACGPDRNTLVAKIESLEAETVSLGQDFAKSPLGAELDKAYAQFIENFPSDSIAPGIVISAAKLAADRSKLIDATSRYQFFIDNYSSSPQLDKVYILLAGLYTERAKDIEKGRETYKAFLDRFPGHKLEADIRFMHDNIDKTPEEILEIILRKQQDTNIR
jgi:outer membrane protein assembly factor BamD (BamD/ComL family)